MRSRWRAALVIAVAVLARPAGAAPLPMTGTLTIEFGLVGPLPVVASSTTITVNGSAPAGHLTGLQIPASAFAATGSDVPVTDPSVFPVAGLALTAHNGAGSFGGVGGAGFGGTMPILGAAKICLYGACGASSNISNVEVPLSVVGQGGWIEPPPIQPVKTVIGAP